MTNYITLPLRVLALVAGAAFFYAQLLNILGTDALNFSAWDSGVQIAVILLAGTTATWLLFDEAWARRQWGAAIGFAVVVLAGTGMVVANSVGKQAEVSMLSASQVDQNAETRIAIKAKLAKDEQRLTDAKERLAKECSTGKGSKCAGIKETIGVYEAAVKGHMADLATLGTPKVAYAREAMLAKMAGLFGFDEVKAKAALILLLPFIGTLVLEWGAIRCIGYAFRKNHVAMNDNAPVAITEGETFTDDDLGGLRKLLDGEPLVPVIKPRAGEHIKPAVRQFFQEHGRRPRKDELRVKFPDVAPVTAWRITNEVEAELMAAA